MLFCFSKESDIPVNLLDSCVEMGIAVHISLNFLTERSHVCIVEKFAGYAVVTESLRMASTSQMFLKRMMDIFGALIGLAVTAFLTVIVGPLIYLSTGSEKTDVFSNSINSGVCTGMRRAGNMNFWNRI